MQHTLSALAATAVLVFAPEVLSQSADSQRRLDTAQSAWNAGDYPRALQILLALLDGPDGEALRRPIAQMTGEVFQTRELSLDGRRIQLSPDGEHATFTVPGTESVLRLVRLGKLPIERSNRFFQDQTIHFVPVNTDIPGAAGSVFAPAGGELLFWVDSEDGRELRVRRLETGAEEPVAYGELLLADARYSGSDDDLLLVASRPGAVDRNQIFSLRRGGEPVPLTTGEGFKTDPWLSPGGRTLVYRQTQRSPVPAQLRGEAQAGDGRARRRRFRRAGSRSFVVRDLESGNERRIVGTDPTPTRDGRALVYRRQDEDGQSVIAHVALDQADWPERDLVASELPLGSFSLSPSGAQMVYQQRPKDDWELFVIPTAADGAPRRLTREIQHDVNPIFVDEDTVLAQVGEPRHRRSWLHPVGGGAVPVRAFHNNTLRTIAPEYEWQVSDDGQKVLILSERDGDTVHPERGVYLVDRGSEVSRPELIERLGSQLEGELMLRAKGRTLFAPIAEQVAQVTESVALDRVYGYQKALSEFDSRHISMPGNEPAGAWIEDEFRRFGYEPERQWFEARGRRGGGAVRTANVIARLEGTVDPDLVYVLGSHYDSVARGPGGDDNASGTAVTLEAARVLADHPLPCTVVFVAFTGEESGLLGSREFVRQAAADGMKVVGALNNDMLGWSNDYRLDNTIRYSNPGIRDVQHSAAMLFSDLITYDALYYKSTDAQAFYDAWGDIVGGIGSYPVLGNPNYHQVGDRLETINHEQVTETAKTTVATLMLLASSPSRLTGVSARQDGEVVQVSWEPSPESEIVAYEVAHGPEGNPGQNVQRVTETQATLELVPEDHVVAVRAVNRRGLVGWDWARAVVAR